MPSSSKFPESFLWGSATSSFQIEGATGAEGRSESIWDRFCQQPGAIDDNANGDIACDHYHRYKEDVALMSSLGLDAYRFSIAWPRVVVLEDKNGWVNRDTAYAFVDYTKAVVERLGDRVASWATLNEPFVSASLGYRTGEHAPGRTSLTDSFAAAHHLLLAHGMAMPVIREFAPNSDAGVVLNFTPAFAASDAAEDQQAFADTDGWDNRWYVEPIAGSGYPKETVQSLGWEQKEVQAGDMDTIAAPIDFLGVNYYTRQTKCATGDAPQTLPVTDMGWEIYPEGIHDLLTTVHNRHGFKKYFITENGAAMPDKADDKDFVDDQDRIDYLHDHLQQVHRAIEAGVPVNGYFAWSLFDNFEWAYGYSKRFGIIRVNYETLERTPKASAHWYSTIAKNGEVSRS